MSYSRFHFILLPQFCVARRFFSPPENHLRRTICGESFAKDKRIEINMDDMHSLQKTLNRAKKNLRDNFLNRLKIKQIQNKNRLFCTNKRNVEECKRMKNQTESTAFFLLFATD